MLQKRFRKFIRVTALVVLICYLPTNLCDASTIASMQEMRLPSDWLTHQALALEIPEKIARIESLHPGPQGMILHIQTAHGHYEAQHKIQKLLTWLQAQYGDFPVLVEGAAGKLDAGRLNFFPKDPVRSLKTARWLAKKALVKGPELFLLSHPHAQGIGIEDAEAYRTNHLQFASVLHAREKTRNFSAVFEQEMEKAATFFSPEMRAFLKRMEQKELGIVSFEGWIGELRNYAHKDLKLDLSDAAMQLHWPMLVRFFKVKGMCERWNSRNYETEKQRFLSALPGEFPVALRGKLASLLNSDGKSVQLPEPETENTFLETIRFLPRDFDWKAYPELVSFIGQLILRSELKPMLLADEMTALENRVSEKLVRNDSERKLLAVFNDYRLLKKLFELQLTPSDFDKVQGSLQTKQNINPSAILKRLNTVSCEPRIAGTVSAKRSPLVAGLMTPASLKELDRLFDLAVAFYRGAQTRDRAMIAHTESYLSAHPSKLAVIVTGGFHTAGMREHFESAGRTYAIVTPSIAGTDAEGYQAYLKVMLATEPKMNMPANQLVESPDATDVVLGQEILFEQILPRVAANVRVRDVLLHESLRRSEVFQGQLESDQDAGEPAFDVDRDETHKHRSEARSITPLNASEKTYQAISAILNKPRFAFLKEKLMPDEMQAFWDEIPGDVVQLNIAGSEPSLKISWDLQQKLEAEKQEDLKTLFEAILVIVARKQTPAIYLPMNLKEEDVKPILARLNNDAMSRLLEEFKFAQNANVFVTEYGDHVFRWEQFPLKEDRRSGVALTKAWGERLFGFLARGAEALIGKGVEITIVQNNPERIEIDVRDYRRTLIFHFAARPYDESYLYLDEFEYHGVEKDVFERFYMTWIAEHWLPMAKEFGFRGGLFAAGDLNQGLIGGMKGVEKHSVFPRVFEVDWGKSDADERIEEVQQSIVPKKQVINFEDISEQLIAGTTRSFFVFRDQLKDPAKLNERVRSILRLGNADGLERVALFDVIDHMTKQRSIPKIKSTPAEEKTDPLYYITNKEGRIQAVVRIDDQNPDEALKDPGTWQYGIVFDATLWPGYAGKKDSVLIATPEISPIYIYPHGATSFPLGGRSGKRTEMILYATSPEQVLADRKNAFGRHIALIENHYQSWRAQKNSKSKGRLIAGGIIVLADLVVAWLLKINLWGSFFFGGSIFSLAGFIANSVTIALVGLVFSLIGLIYDRFDGLSLTVSKDVRAELKDLRGIAESKHVSNETLQSYRLIREFFENLDKKEFKPDYIHPIVEIFSTGVGRALLESWKQADEFVEIARSESRVITPLNASEKTYQALQSLLNQPELKLLKDMLMPGGGEMQVFWDEIPGVAAALDVAEGALKINWELKDKLEAEDSASLSALIEAMIIALARNQTPAISILPSHKVGDVETTLLRLNNLKLSSLLRDYISQPLPTGPHQTYGTPIFWQERPEVAASQIPASLPITEQDAMNIVGFLMRGAENILGQKVSANILKNNPERLSFEVVNEAKERMLFFSFRVAQKTKLYLSEMEWPGLREENFRLLSMAWFGRHLVGWARGRGFTELMIPSGNVLAPATLEYYGFESKTDYNDAFAISLHPAKTRLLENEYANEYSRIGFHEIRARKIPNTTKPYYVWEWNLAGGIVPGTTLESVMSLLSPDGFLPPIYKTIIFSRMIPKTKNPPRDVGTFGWQVNNDQPGFIYFITDPRGEVQAIVRSDVDARAEENKTENWKAGFVFNTEMWPGYTGVPQEIIILPPGTPKIYIQPKDGKIQVGPVPAPTEKETPITFRIHRDTPRQFAERYHAKLQSLIAEMQKVLAGHEAVQDQKFSRYFKWIFSPVVALDGINVLDGWFFHLIPMPAKTVVNAVFFLVGGLVYWSAILKWRQFGEKFFDRSGLTGVSVTREALSKVLDYVNSPDAQDSDALIKKFENIVHGARSGFDDQQFSDTKTLMWKIKGVFQDWDKARKFDETSRSEARVDLLTGLIDRAMLALETREKLMRGSAAVGVGYDPMYGQLVSARMNSFAGWPNKQVLELADLVLALTHADRSVVEAAFLKRNPNIKFPARSEFRRFVTVLLVAFNIAYVPYVIYQYGELFKGFNSDVMYPDGPMYLEYVSHRDDRKPLSKYTREKIAGQSAQELKKWAAGDDKKAMIRAWVASYAHHSENGYIHFAAVTDLAKKDPQWIPVIVDAASAVLRELDLGSKENAVHVAALRMFELFGVLQSDAGFAEMARVAVDPKTHPSIRYVAIFNLPEDVTSRFALEHWVEMYLSTYGYLSQLAERHIKSLENPATVRFTISRFIEELSKLDKDKQTPRTLADKQKLESLLKSLNATQIKRSEQRFADVLITSAFVMFGSGGTVALVRSLVNALSVLVAGHIAEPLSTYFFNGSIGLMSVSLIPLFGALYIHSRTPYPVLTSPQVENWQEFIDASRSGYGSIHFQAAKQFADIVEYTVDLKSNENIEALKRLISKMGDEGLRKIMDQVVSPIALKDDAVHPLIKLYVHDGRVIGFTSTADFYNRVTGYVFGNTPAQAKALMRAMNENESNLGSVGPHREFFGKLVTPDRLFLNDLEKGKVELKLINGVQRSEMRAVDFNIDGEVVREVTNDPEYLNATEGPAAGGAQYSHRGYRVFLLDRKLYPQNAETQAIENKQIELIENFKEWMIVPPDKRFLVDMLDRLKRVRRLIFWVSPEGYLGAFREDSASPFTPNTNIGFVVDRGFRNEEVFVHSAEGTPREVRQNRIAQLQTDPVKVVITDDLLRFEVPVAGDDKAYVATSPKAQTKPTASSVAATTQAPAAPSNPQKPIDERVFNPVSGSAIVEIEEILNKEKFYQVLYTEIGGGTGTLQLYWETDADQPAALEDVDGHSLILDARLENILIHLIDKDKKNGILLIKALLNYASYIRDKRVLETLPWKPIAALIQKYPLLDPLKILEKVTSVKAEKSGDASRFPIRMEIVGTVGDADLLVFSDPPRSQPRRQAGELMNVLRLLDPHKKAMPTDIATILLTALENDQPIYYVVNPKTKRVTAVFQKDPNDSNFDKSMWLWGLVLNDEGWDRIKFQTNTRIILKRLDLPELTLAFDQSSVIGNVGTANILARSEMRALNAINPEEPVGKVLTGILTAPDSPFAELAEKIGGKDSLLIYWADEMETAADLDLAEHLFGIDAALKEKLNAVSEDELNVLLSAMLVASMRDDRKKIRFSVSWAKLEKILEQLGEPSLTELLKRFKRKRSVPRQAIPPSASVATPVLSAQSKPEPRPIKTIDGRAALQVVDRSIDLLKGDAQWGTEGNKPGELSLSESEASKLLNPFMDSLAALANRLSATLMTNEKNNLWIAFTVNFKTGFYLKLEKPGDGKAVLKVEQKKEPLDFSQIEPLFVKRVIENLIPWLQARDFKSLKIETALPFWTKLQQIAGMDEKQAFEINENNLSALRRAFAVENAVEGPVRSAVKLPGVLPALFAVEASEIVGGDFGLHDLIGLWDEYGRDADDLVRQIAKFDEDQPYYFIVNEQGRIFEIIQADSGLAAPGNWKAGLVFDGDPRKNQLIDLPDSIAHVANVPPIYLRLKSGLTVDSISSAPVEAFVTPVTPKENEAYARDSFKASVASATLIFNDWLNSQAARLQSQTSKSWWHFVKDPLFVLLLYFGVWFWRPLDFVFMVMGAYLFFSKVGSYWRAIDEVNLLSKHQYPEPYDDFYDMLQQFESVEKTGLSAAFYPLKEKFEALENKLSPETKQMTLFHALRRAYESYQVYFKAEVAARSEMRALNAINPEERVGKVLTEILTAPAGPFSDLAERIGGGEDLQIYWAGEMEEPVALDLDDHALYFNENQKTAWNALAEYDLMTLMRAWLTALAEDAHVPVRREVVWSELEPLLKKINDPSLFTLFERFKTIPKSVVTKTGGFSATWESPASPLVGDPLPLSLKMTNKDLEELADYFIRAARFYRGEELSVRVIVNEDTRIAFNFYDAKGNEILHLAVQGDPARKYAVQEHPRDTWGNDMEITRVWTKWIARTLMPWLNGRGFDYFSSGMDEIEKITSLPLASGELPANNPESIQNVQHVLAPRYADLFAEKYGEIHENPPLNSAIGGYIFKHEISPFALFNPAVQILEQLNEDSFADREMLAVLFGNASVDLDENLYILTGKNGRISALYRVNKDPKFTPNHVDFERSHVNPSEWVSGIIFDEAARSDFLKKYGANILKPSNSKPLYLRPSHKRDFSAVGTRRMDDFHVDALSPEEKAREAKNKFGNAVWQLDLAIGRRWNFDAPGILGVMRTGLGMLIFALVFPVTKAVLHPEIWVMAWTLNFLTFICVASGAYLMLRSVLIFIIEKEPWLSFQYRKVKRAHRELKRLHDELSGAYDLTNDAKALEKADASARVFRLMKVKKDSPDGLVAQAGIEADDRFQDWVRASAFSKSARSELRTLKVNKWPIGKKVYLEVWKNFYLDIHFKKIESGQAFFNIGKKMYGQKTTQSISLSVPLKDYPGNSASGLLDLSEYGINLKATISYAPSGYWKAVFFTLPVGRVWLNKGFDRVWGNLDVGGEVWVYDKKVGTDDVILQQLLRQADGKSIRLLPAEETAFIDGGNKKGNPIHVFNTRGVEIGRSNYGALLKLLSAVHGRIYPSLFYVPLWERVLRHLSLAGALVLRAVGLDGPEAFFGLAVAILLLPLWLPSLFIVLIRQHLRKYEAAKFVAWRANGMHSMRSEVRANEVKNWYPGDESFVTLGNAGSLHDSVGYRVYFKEVKDDNAVFLIQDGTWLEKLNDDGLYFKLGDQPLSFTVPLKRSPENILSGKLVVDGNNPIEAGFQRNAQGGWDFSFDVLPYSTEVLKYESRIAPRGAAEWQVNWNIDPEADLSRLVMNRLLQFSDGHEIRLIPAEAALFHNGSADDPIRVFDSDGKEIGRSNGEALRKLLIEVHGRIYPALKTVSNREQLLRLLSVLTSFTAISIYKKKLMDSLLEGEKIKWLIFFCNWFSNIALALVYLVLFIFIVPVQTADFFLHRKREREADQFVAWRANGMHLMRSEARTNNQYALSEADRQMLPYLLREKLNLNNAWNYDGYIKPLDFSRKQRDEFNREVLRAFIHAAHNFTTNHHHSVSVSKDGRLHRDLVDPNEDLLAALERNGFYESAEFKKYLVGPFVLSRVNNPASGEPEWVGLTSPRATTLMRHVTHHVISEALDGKVSIPEMSKKNFEKGVVPPFIKRVILKINATISAIVAHEVFGAVLVAIILRFAFRALAAVGLEGLFHIVEEKLNLHVGEGHIDMLHVFLITLLSIWVLHPFSHHLDHVFQHQERRYYEDLLLRAIYGMDREKNQENLIKFDAGLIEIEKKLEKLGAEQDPGRESFSKKYTERAVALRNGMVRLWNKIKWIAVTRDLRRLFFDSATKVQRYNDFVEVALSMIGVAKAAQLQIGEQDIVLGMIDQFADFYPGALRVAVSKWEKQKKRWDAAWQILTVGRLGSRPFEVAADVLLRSKKMSDNFMDHAAFRREFARRTLVEETDLPRTDFEKEEYLNNVEHKLLSDAAWREKYDQFFGDHFPEFIKANVQSLKDRRSVVIAYFLGGALHRLRLIQQSRIHDREYILRLRNAGTTAWKAMFAKLGQDAAEYGFEQSEVVRLDAVIQKNLEQALEAASLVARSEARKITPEEAAMDRAVRTHEIYFHMTRLLADYQTAKKAGALALAGNLLDSMRSWKKTADELKNEIRFVDGENQSRAKQILGMSGKQLRDMKRAIELDYGKVRAQLFDTERSSGDDARFVALSQQAINLLKLKALAHWVTFIEALNDLDHHQNEFGLILFGLLRAYSRIAAHHSGQKRVDPAAFQAALRKVVTSEGNIEETLDYGSMPFARIRFHADGSLTIRQRVWKYADVSHGPEALIADWVEMKLDSASKGERQLIHEVEWYRADYAALMQYRFMLDRLVDEAQSLIAGRKSTDEKISPELKDQIDAIINLMSLGVPDDKGKKAHGLKLKRVQLLKANSATSEALPQPGASLKQAQYDLNQAARENIGHLASMIVDLKQTAAWIDARLENIAVKNEGVERKLYDLQRKIRSREVLSALSKLQAVLSNSNRKSEDVQAAVGTLQALYQKYYRFVARESVYYNQQIQMNFLMASLRPIARVGEAISPSQIVGIQQNIAALRAAINARSESRGTEVVGPAESVYAMFMKLIGDEQKTLSRALTQKLNMFEFPQIYWDGNIDKAAHLDWDMGSLYLNVDLKNSLNKLSETDLEIVIKAILMKSLADAEQSFPEIITADQVKEVLGRVQLPLLETYLHEIVNGKLKPAVLTVARSLPVSEKQQRKQAFDKALGEFKESVETLENVGKSWAEPFVKLREWVNGLKEGETNVIMVTVLSLVFGEMILGVVFKLDATKNPLHWIWFISVGLLALTPGAFYLYFVKEETGNWLTDHFPGMSPKGKILPRAILNFKNILESFEAKTKDPAKLFSEMDLAESYHKRILKLAQAIKKAQAASSGSKRVKLDYKLDILRVYQTAYEKYETLIREDRLSMVARSEARKPKITQMLSLEGFRVAYGYLSVWTYLGTTMLHSAAKARAKKLPHFLPDSWIDFYYQYFPKWLVYQGASFLGTVAVLFMFARLSNRHFGYLRLFIAGALVAFLNFLFEAGVPSGANGLDRPDVYAGIFGAASYVAIHSAEIYFGRPIKAKRSEARVEQIEAEDEKVLISKADVIDPRADGVQFKPGVYATSTTESPVAQRVDADAVASRLLRAFVKEKSSMLPKTNPFFILYNKQNKVIGVFRVLDINGSLVNAFGEVRGNIVKIVLKSILPYDISVIRKARSEIRGVALQATRPLLSETEARMFLNRVVRQGILPLGEMDRLMKQFGGDWVQVAAAVLQKFEVSVIADDVPQEKPAILARRYPNQHVTAAQQTFKQDIKPLLLDSFFIESLLEEDNGGQALYELISSGDHFVVFDTTGKLSERIFSKLTNRESGLARVADISSLKMNLAKTFDIRKVSATDLIQSQNSYLAHGAEWGVGALLFSQDSLGKIRGPVVLALSEAVKAGDVQVLLAVTRVINQAAALEISGSKQAAFDYLMRHLGKLTPSGHGWLMDSMSKLVDVLIVSHGLTAVSA